MSTFTPNYNLEKPEASDPFENFRQSYNNNMDEIDRNLGGGGGSGGHTIYDKDGNALAQESGLQFTGSVNVTDDAVNGRTVVDISGGSNLILDAQIYSTEEKQIGVWIDKKPLYQKTIQTGYLPNNSSMYISTPSNIENLVHYLGFAYSPNSPSNQRPLPFSAGGSNDIRVDLDEGVIRIMVFSNWSTYNGYLTIQYTKTTDVAGSGGYEAYEFSPVIYSDVERKIGVWRDNKPLYAKTWDLGSDITVNANSWTNTSIIVSDFNIEKIVNVGCLNNGGSFFGFVGANRDQTYVQLLQTRNTIISVRYVTLLYTKTTDVAGSGDYNTYGVPTVHYDTSEQVVGTWLGKPLYENVLTLTQDTNLIADTWVKTEFSRTTMQNLIKVVAVISSSGAVIEALSGGFIDDKLSLNSARNVGLNVADNARLIVQYTKVTD